MKSAKDLHDHIDSILEDCIDKDEHQEMHELASRVLCHKILELRHLFNIYEQQFGQEALKEVLDFMNNLQRDE